MTLDGVLPVLKPVDFTSHDVVAKVRRLIGVKRIGHTGTLDPKVTGVLPLCIGKATRVVEYIQDLPKSYEAELAIGIATDTEDLTGEPVVRLPGVKLTEAQVREAVLSFVGTIDQIPPMYSAVKVDGKRLYELARQGREVERKPRAVTIYRIEITQLDLERDYPLIRFAVDCSKGTYIRTLCADIGRKLGVPAAMASLVRTSSGSMTLPMCLTLEEIERLAQIGELAPRLIPADRAIGHLPACTVADADALRAQQGQKINLPVSARSEVPAFGEDAAEPSETPPVWRVYAAKGDFVGLFAPDLARGLLVPVKVWN
ncbi:MAG: tRNA pseudouridine(55) synthase TruB [Paenibacillaceae bacterium]|nr:tRNA pseudouridine(55) synthase TruB [Paenibacillaceae bacterium]